MALAFATSSTFVIAGTVAVDFVLLLPQPEAPSAAISSPAIAIRRDRTARSRRLLVVVGSGRDSLVIGSSWLCAGPLPNQIGCSLVGCPDGARPRPRSQQTLSTSARGAQPQAGQSVADQNPTKERTMTLALAITFNAVLMLTLLGALAFVMSRAGSLKPHLSATGTPAIQLVQVRRDVRAPGARKHRWRASAPSPEGA
jgi:hypothetical protein